MRLAKIDNETVTEFFDGPTREDLESRYPDSTFAQADPIVQRGWAYLEGLFIDPNAIPTQSDVPSAQQLAVAITAERDSRVNAFADSWDDFTREDLLPLWKNEIALLDDDQVAPNPADYPALTGGAASQFGKEMADVTVADIEGFVQVVKGSIQSAAAFSQKSTMVTRDLIAELPNLSRAEREVYDVAARFDQGMTS